MTPHDKYADLIAIFVIVAVGVGALLGVIFFILSLGRPTNVVDEPTYREGLDVHIDPAGLRGYWLRGLSALFAALSVISFLWAEFSWDVSTPKDGGIGIGTSGYALVLYARAIALACISGAFAILSHGDLVFRWIRITYAKHDEIQK